MRRLLLLLLLLQAAHQAQQVLLLLEQGSGLYLAVIRLMPAQLRRIINVLLIFAEKNPGMTRVLIGDALVNEDDALQQRVNQLLDRLEITIKQSLKIAVTDSGKKILPEAEANLMISFVIGRWHQFAKSGFKRKPMEFAQLQLGMFD